MILRFDRVVRGYARGRVLLFSGMKSEKFSEKTEFVVMLEARRLWSTRE